MDAETQPMVPHENGAKIEESSTDPPGNTEASVKDDETTKTAKTKKLPQTRSRSRTPQKLRTNQNEETLKSKKDETKVLTLTLKKVDEGMEGHNEKKIKSLESKDSLKKDDKKTFEKSSKKKEKQDNRDEDFHEGSSESKDTPRKGPEKASKKKDKQNDNLHERGSLESKVTPKKEEKKRSEKLSKKIVKQDDNVREGGSLESKTTPKKDEKKAPGKPCKKIDKEVNEDKGLLDKYSESKETSKDEEKKEHVKISAEKEILESSRNEISTEEIQKFDEKELLESEVPSQNNAVIKPVAEPVEMDPLILATDEPDPELQFDENSDLESGKGSPIQVRCKTRRSQTRNIPTPKTPKSTDSESEKNSVAPTLTPDPSENGAHTKTENLNDTNDSVNVDDVSTRAEAGSDVTRLDYIGHNTSVTSDDHSYLNYSRERSLGETLRALSPRKTIRPLNDCYRKRAFKNNQSKSDLNIPYPAQDYFGRVTGLKRKRSPTPENKKRFRSESPGFTSYISSPITTFKNKLRPNATSSSPKLTGYKDGSKDIHEDVSYAELVSETPEKKNWCAIM